ncbi:pilus assembly protein [Nocardiopsis terrae]
MAEDRRGPGRTRGPRGRRGSRRSGEDRGAVFVEFAAMVPFMMLALALVWQVLLLGVTAMYASHGAAEAARQAAVTPDDLERIDEEARKRVRAPWDAEDVLSTEIVERDGGRYARVSLDMPVFLPGTSGPWQITGEAKVVTEVTPRGLPDPGEADR